MDFTHIAKPGLIKSRAYCPNPIVRYGIPGFADTVANPKVKGTPAYNQWWDEQLYYIINGYETGGIKIPGRYYKFVNFDIFRGVASDRIRAELHDFQLDYAYLVEQAKAEKKNIIIPKARRKSATTMNICMVIDYGYRFLLNYKAAIIAGKQEFADVFYDEWKYVDSQYINEFRIKRLQNGEDTVAGYKIDGGDGSKLESGTRNTIYTRTVFHDPNVMKGKFLHDAVLEESGENENLVEVFNATRDCLMQGTVQRGNFFIYGTGGQMDRGSKGFKKMWHEYDAFNCLRWFIPATVFYFPFYAGATDSTTGELVEDIPNLQHMAPHERVGFSDEERALEEIEREKKKLLAKADLEEYFKFTQNNPTNIKEVFRKSASNNFPIIQMNDQAYKIESEERRYGKFKLEYKKNPQTGEVLIPYEVEAIPAPDDVPEKDCVLILHEGHPIKGFRWLEVAGLDSYDQDQSKTSKSLGAMVVFRRQHNIGTVPQWLPVALIRNRPDRKEQFYELCMRLSIYYDLVGTVLIDIRNGLIIQHFKEHGCERFLSRRPRKFESPNSEQTNEYGVSLNKYSKPKMVGALQTFFALHIEKVWFLKIIEEALDYDEYEDDSDNDTVDALGIALMKALDMDHVAVNEDELMAANPYEYPEWGQNEAGNIVDLTREKIINDKEPLGKFEDYFNRMARIQLNGQDEDKDLPGDLYGL